MTKLETINAEDLQNRTYEPTPFLVDELIPEGLHILAGAPKIGKSWLALWLCLCVAQGQALWNFATTQGEVLYLSLEDSFQRIQTRLFDLTEDAPPMLHFAIMADTLKHGLEQQIEQFLTEHPDTKLVVIDTLQRVRGTGSDSNLYANDYHDIGILKQLAGRRQIAILLMVQQKPTLRRRAGNAKKRRLKAQRSPAAAGKILPFGRSQHRIWLVAGAPAPRQMLFAGRSPHPLLRHKVRCACNALRERAFHAPLPCSSVPNKTRFAGLLFGRGKRKIRRKICEKINNSAFESRNRI